MKFFVFLLFAISLCKAGVVEYPQTVEIKETDSAADIIEKAASVRPSARQLEYHQEEFIAFIHFGPNTFTGVDWGNGKEYPKVFNPPVVDTDQRLEFFGQKHKARYFRLVSKTGAAGKPYAAMAELEIFAH